MFLKNNSEISKRAIMTDYCKTARRLDKIKQMNFDSRLAYVVIFMKHKKVFEVGIYLRD